MTTRDRDRDREAGRDSSRYPSGSGSAKTSHSKLAEFFVNGDRIHREVMQMNVAKYLGPEAHSRPSTYNGIKGYIVTATQPFTTKQVDQLVELSEAYESENRENRARRRKDVSYEQSDTLRRLDATSNVAGAPYEQDHYLPQGPYTPYTTGNTMPGSQAGYGAGYSGPTNPSDPRYPSDPRQEYAQGAMYPNPHYSSDPRHEYAQSPMYPNPRDVYPPSAPKRRMGDTYYEDERGERGERIDESRRRERDRDRDRGRDDVDLRDPGFPRDSRSYLQGDYREPTSYPQGGPEMARGPSMQSGYSSGSGYIAPGHPADPSQMGGYGSHVAPYGPNDMRPPYGPSGTPQSMYPPRGPPPPGPDPYRNPPRRDDRYGR